MVNQIFKQLNIRIPLDGTYDLDNNLSMAATIYLPNEIDTSARQPIFFLLPGAGYSRNYFDIRHPGFDGYSQVAHHAANGIVSVAIDHLGVGESSVPPGAQFMFQHSDPAYQGIPSLTIATMAAACATAVHGIIERLRAGTLDKAIPPFVNPVPIGVGQSMGGFVVTTAQADHECFDGIALLGSSMTLTNLAMKPGHRRPFRAAGPSDRLLAIQNGIDMAASFHLHDEPEELVRADMDFDNPPPWRSIAIPSAAGALTNPLAIATHAARVRVPVLLAFGEEDVTLEPLADLAVFRSTYDLSMLLIPNMAHMHNFSKNRAWLWRRIEQCGLFLENLPRS